MMEKALKQGDALPPVTPDLLRIYSMRFCPFAQRTLMVLHYKQLPHEVVNIHLREKPAWFLEKTPQGQVPVLEVKGQVVYDSTICDDFLDRMYPDSGEGLLSSPDPQEWARQQLVMHHFDNKVSGPYFTVLRAADPDKTAQAKTALAAALCGLETRLGDNQYFGGAKPGLVDFHVFPWFERIPVLKKICNAREGGGEYDPLPPDTYPCLSRWVVTMKTLPAVQAVLRPPELHHQYMISLGNGKSDYDLGLSSA